MSTTSEPAAKNARVYSVDAAHTSAAFIVRHMMIAKVRGHFNAVTGTIELPVSGNVPTSIEASIDAASVDTREPKRDAHLRSADYFETEKYPQLTFRSTRIQGTDAALRITGDLTIHGVTREVTFDGTFEGTGRDPRGNQRVGYEAHAQVSRKDFGLTAIQTLETGGVLVGDEVRIELNVEAVASNA